MKEQDDTLISIKPEEYVIKLKPMLNKNKKWTGEVRISVVVSEDNNLDDNDYYNMLYLANLVSATANVMEVDKNFRYRLMNYVDNEEKVAKIKNKNNVIYLDFSSETEGNA
tara:strand:- start:6346 stop:6678 length:333 start_codon:yes stop_codon:yes gene_type:complete